MPGVGRHKLELYGTVFLDCIADYAARHPEEVPQDLSGPADPEETPLRRDRPERRKREGREEREEGALSATVEESGLLLAQGLSIEATAAQRGLKPGTILLHLEQLVDNGATFPEEQFMPAPRLAELAALFQACGGPQLKPVVEAPAPPGGAVDYEEARLARLLLRFRHQRAAESDPSA